MKRLGTPIAALLGVAVIGLVATSWFINRDALRAAVEAQIRAVTGLDLMIKGNIEVSVFPATTAAPGRGDRKVPGGIASRIGVRQPSFSGMSLPTRQRSA